MVIPHAIVLMIYGIGAFFAVIGAWFSIVFTGKYPEGLYKFNEGYARYSSRVYAYASLATDGFPPFSGDPNQEYNSYFSVGPPLETYSRSKAFFRAILAIPFYIVAYVLTLIYQVVSLVAWFVIVITGKQPKGLQDALLFGLSYEQRLKAYYLLMTEDWPVYWTDDANDQHLAELGYVGTSSATPFESAPPETPAPPAPPAPPSV